MISLISSNFILTTAVCKRL